MACCRYPESLPFPLQLSAPKVVLELELRTSDRWASGCEALQVRPDWLLDSEQLELNSSKEILTSLLGSEIKERGTGWGERQGLGWGLGHATPPGPPEEPRRLVSYTNCYPLTSNYPSVRAINYKSAANWGN